MRSAFRGMVFSLGLVSALAVAENGGAADHEITLLDPARFVETDWRERAFGEPTRYRRAIADERAAVEAAGVGSAAGLFRRVGFDPGTYPVIEWSWRVDDMPRGADLRTTAADDVGASLSFVFGEMRLFGPEPPTLVYAWAGATTPVGTVVASPRHPEKLRTLVLRSAETNPGTWRAERRNLVEDYRRVFGEAPPTDVEWFAIWSDSDQTNDSVRAYYGKVVARRPARD